MGVTTTRHAYLYACPHTLSYRALMTEWADYVQRVAGTDITTEIAKKTGINQSSIYRWLHDGAVPSTAHAARFAQSYDRNVLEAFVAADFLTEEEAKLPRDPSPDLTKVPAKELVREVGRRLLDAEVRSETTDEELLLAFHHAASVGRDEVTRHATELVLPIMERFADASEATQLAMVRFSLPPVEKVLVEAPQRTREVLGLVGAIASQIQAMHAAGDLKSGHLRAFSDGFFNLSTDPMFTVEDLTVRLQRALSDMMPTIELDEVARRASVGK